MPLRLWNRKKPELRETTDSAQFSLCWIDKKPDGRHAIRLFFLVVFGLGSTGCQPVGFGSLPKQSFDTVRYAKLLPASCRQLQASSLRSPEYHVRMIIEMRTYKIKPGLRAKFLKTFEAKVRPEHEKIGMKILGPFLSIEDPDTFFWMRPFPDMRTREKMRDQFYEGKLFKEDLEKNHVPMLKKYDVVVVEAKEGLGSWR